VQIQGGVKSLTAPLKYSRTGIHILHTQVLHPLVYPKPWTARGKNKLLKRNKLPVILTTAPINKYKIDT